uniref:SRCR domain-containing protein n=1 Tax=Nothobranchius furzeri TaxID=105023 RepID=A0A8C6NWS4_NOTFU
DQIYSILHNHGLLTVFLLVCSSGLRAEQPAVKSEVRLKGGTSRCDGTLERKDQGDWKNVEDQRMDWTMTSADSVRLVNGTGLCSGRLEVNFNQSWSPVSEDGFDQQDAEVVCKELGCGSPSVLQGALYGETEDPTWKFQCEGKESALLDCRISGSERNTCSPGKASCCAGRMEVLHQDERRPVYDLSGDWNNESAAAVCSHLGCGSVVLTRTLRDSPHQLVWRITPSCLPSYSLLRSIQDTCSGNIFSSCSPGFIYENLRRALLLTPTVFQTPFPTPEPLLCVCVCVLPSSLFIFTKMITFINRCEYSGVFWEILTKARLQDTLLS